MAKPGPAMARAATMPKLLLWAIDRFGSAGVVESVIANDRRNVAFKTLVNGQKTTLDCYILITSCFAESAVQLQFGRPLSPKAPCSNPPDRTLRRGAARL